MAHSDPGALLWHASAIPVGSWREAHADIQQAAPNIKNETLGVRRWSKQLLEAISARDARLATHLSAVAILLAPKAAFQEIRRHGLLRASRNANACRCVKPIVSELLEAANTLSLSFEARSYLESVRNLHLIADALYELRERLAVELRDRGPAVFDGLVRTVDYGANAQGADVAAR